jgi:hypothetical protein
MAPKKSVIVPTPQRANIITQNKSSGIVISNVSSGPRINPGQSPQQVPKKPINQNSPQNQVPAKLGRPFGSTNSIPKDLNITTVGGAKITSLSNRPQLKVTTMPGKSQIGSIAKPQLTSSQSAAVQKISEIAKAGNIQFIKRGLTQAGASSSNPQGLQLQSQSGVRKTIVAKKPGASQIDINRLAKNTAITISAVKEAVPQLAGTTGMALKRAMENSALSVIPAKKAKVVAPARRPGNGAGPGPGPRPGGSSGQRE